MLEQAQKSNERQIAIVKDLLLIASLDAGKIELRLNSVDLVELVESVASEQQTKLRERRQKVVVQHRKICRVSADPELLRMVIENLLDNASKYSTESTTIKLTLACEAGNAHIAFSDQGVGIHEEDMGKLFRKFSRIDNPFSQIVGGSGLGLYWAKKIIDLHGGTITVNSSPGVGTTFTVALTATPKPAARFSVSA
jgi:signal transduction histidine kinase